MLILLLLILWIVQILYVYQAGQRNAMKQAEKKLNQSIPLQKLNLKTGDLILFSKQNRTGMACYFNSSMFTHVGLVYQDPENQEFYVLESIMTKAVHRIQSRVSDRIEWYQKHGRNNDTDALNKVAVRRLNRELESWQYEALHRAVQEMSPAILDDPSTDSESLEGIDSVSARVNAYLPKTYDCLMTYVFEEKLPTDNSTRMLCTDFVAYLLQQAFVLNTAMNGRCIFVEWFQAQLINDYMLSPDSYWYLDELIYIQPITTLV